MLRRGHQPNTHYWIATCNGPGMAWPSLRLRAPCQETSRNSAGFSFMEMMMEQNRQHRRGESVMLTFRFPRSLYEALPVKPAPNAGVPAGRSGYLRRLLVEAVERDLATEECVQVA